MYLILGGTWTNIFILTVVYFSSFIVVLEKMSTKIHFEASFGQMRLKFDMPYPMPHLHRYLLSVFFFLRISIQVAPFFFPPSNLHLSPAAQCLFSGSSTKQPLYSSSLSTLPSCPATPFHLQPIEFLPLIYLCCSGAAHWLSEERALTPSDPSARDGGWGVVNAFLFGRKNKWLYFWGITKSKVSIAKLWSTRPQMKDENIRWER